MVVRMSSFGAWSFERDVQEWLLPYGLSLPSQPVRHAVMHSKQVLSGDVFIACGAMGERAQHIAEARARGASCVVQSSEGESYWQESHGMLEVFIQHLPDQLGALLHDFYQQPSEQLTVIAITGTNGKTSTAIFVAQLASHAGVRAGVMGTLGVGVWPSVDETGLTTPDVATVHRGLAYLLAEGVGLVALEASSHGLTQNRLDGVAIDVGVLTNISQDHLDYHGSMEAYAAAKAKLFERPLRAAVFNVDDAHGGRWHERHGGKGYGMASSANVRIHSVHCDVDGFVAGVQSPWGEGTLQAPIPGAFQVGNVVAAMTALLCCDFAWTSLLQGVKTLKAAPGRMEAVKAVAGMPRVVVDYAHTPDALEKTLQSLQALCDGELWCVFGCGGNRDRGKRPLMAVAAESHSDHVVVTSDNPRFESPDAIMADIREGFKDPHAAEFIVSRADAIAWAIQHASSKDTICIAGKGHETFQLIGDQRLPFSDVQCAHNILMGEGANA